MKAWEADVKMGDDTSNDNVWTEIEYTVKDPKFQNEKPYDIRYDIGKAMPMTNASSESKEVLIQNFRLNQDASSFDNFGFSLEKIAIDLTEEIFDDISSIKTTVYPLIEEVLRRKFPDASSVHILEHSVSRLIQVIAIIALD
jgi:hypothetical protein